MNISINVKLLVEREPVIGQILIDMRGRKPAWEGIRQRVNYLMRDCQPRDTYHVDHSTNFARNSVARRRLQEAQPQWTRTTNEIATNPAMAAVTPRRNLDSWFTPLSPANVHSYWVAGAVWS